MTNYVEKIGRTILIYVTITSVCLDIVLEFTDRINSDNDGRDKIYEIVINQQHQISSSESKIDMFIKQYGQYRDKCINSEDTIIRQTSQR